MNAFSVAAEIDTYIDEFLADGRAQQYITSSLTELEETWDHDPIAGELFRDLLPIRSRVFRDVRKKVERRSLMDLRTLVRALVRRKDEYGQQIVAKLRDAISRPEDLTQKHRVLREISDLTRRYVTLLLNNGYSPTYLFNRAQFFTRPNKFGGRSFDEQFARIAEQLRSQVVEYDVHFAIATGSPDLLLSVTDEPGMVLEANAPASLSDPNRELIVRGVDAKVFATCQKVRATDPITAAFKSKERLDRLLDQATALELIGGIRVGAHSIATFTINNSAYSRHIDVDKLLGFMSSEIGTYFSASEGSVRDAVKSLSEDAVDRLGRSLRYLRIARDAVSMDQKLLNLWIALESLFDKSGTTLSRVLEYVPRLYAVAGLHRRVAYLRDLLAANTCPISPLAGQVMGDPGAVFSQEITENMIFLLLRNEPAAIEQFEALGELEHLKFRFLFVYDEVKDNAAISIRLKKSATDVTRQLRRIYFLRNKIAHSGFHGAVRPQLATHLLDYIAVCYRAISKAAACAEVGAKYSISDLLISARLGAEKVEARVALGTPPVTALSEVLLSPIL